MILPYRESLPNWISIHRFLGIDPPLQEMKGIRPSRDITMNNGGREIEQCAHTQAGVASSGDERKRGEPNARSRLPSILLRSISGVLPIYRQRRLGCSSVAHCLSVRIRQTPIIFSSHCQVQTIQSAAQRQRATLRSESVTSVDNEDYWRLDWDEDIFTTY